MTRSFIQASNTRRAIVGFASRPAATMLAVLGFGVIPVTACNDSTQESDLGGSQSPASAVRARIVGTRLQGSCNERNAAVAAQESAVTVTFSSGTPLTGHSKETAEECVLSIAMKVPAGYQFSPINSHVRGAADNAMLFGEYRWANSNQTSYTFERPVNGDYRHEEPLSRLWSPTCNGSKSGEVDAEFIVSIKPYTTNNPESTVDVYSFDVAGLGDFQKCDGTRGDTNASEGDDCGIVAQNNNSYVNCSPDRPLTCVFSPYSEETGVCVDRTKKTPKAQLSEKCGGPAFTACASESLVCQFRNGNARQNASSHYGVCEQKLALGAACARELYGACDGLNCNTQADPCQAGAKCDNGKCVATQKQTPAQSGDPDRYQGSPDQNSTQNQDFGQPEATDQTDPASSDDVMPPQNASSTQPEEEQLATSAEDDDVAADDSDVESDANDLWSSFWG